MKKLAVTCTACLVVITALLTYQTWSEYKRSREAEAAMAEMDARKPPRMKVEVPEDSIRTSSTPDQLVVFVDEKGRLKIGSQDVGTTDDVSRLRAELARALGERGDRGQGKAVLVKASGNLPYGEVAKIIEAAKGAGAEPVGLQTDVTK